MFQRVNPTGALLELFCREAWCPSAWNLHSSAPAPQRWRQASSGNAGVRMLLFADFLPPLTLLPHCQGPQRRGQLERACRTRGGASVLLPGSPGVRWDQGDRASVRRRISPPQPAPCQGRRQRSLPASLPPSQAMERKLGQASSLLLLAGGRGKGPHCSFPQTSRA